MKQSIGGDIRAAAFLAMTEESSVSLWHKKAIHRRTVGCIVLVNECTRQRNRHALTLAQQINRPHLK